jgi:tRNA dimethylallyltransferase
VRALEIFAVTGRTASSWHEEHRLAERPYRYATIAVSAPRAELHRRIGVRTRVMIDAGLVGEVCDLLAAGAPATAAAFGAIGYREALQVVQGELPESALFETLSASTRQYARRQLVWLRGQLEDLHWFHSGSVADSIPSIAAALSVWRAGDDFRGGFGDEPGAIG